MLSLFFILCTYVSTLSACDTFTASNSDASVTYTIDECTGVSGSSVKVYCKNGEAYSQTYSGSSTCSSGSQGENALSWYSDSGYTVVDCCAGLASGGTTNSGSGTTISTVCAALKVGECQAYGGASAQYYCQGGELYTQSYTSSDCSSGGVGATAAAGYSECCSSSSSGYVPPVCTFISFIFFVFSLTVVAHF